MARNSKPQKYKWLGTPHHIEIQILLLSSELQATANCDVQRMISSGGAGGRYPQVVQQRTWFDSHIQLSILACVMRSDELY